MAPQRRLDKCSKYSKCSKLIHDKIEIPRNKISQLFDEVIPTLKKSKDSDSIQVECGFWLECKLPRQNVKRVQYSTSTEFPANISAFLTDDCVDIPYFFIFTKCRRNEIYQNHDRLNTRSPPTIVISNLKLDDILQKMGDTMPIETLDFVSFQLDKKSYSAEQLEKLLRPSLVGIGAETVHDTSVRLASEFNGQSYCFPSKSMWDSFQTFYLEFLQRPCKIQFDKVSVYKKGDFFKEHRDTVYAPNHIGTLLIGTDYEYTGGKFKIAGNSLTISEHSVVFFYTDMAHLVEPVESGTRVVMQFKVFLADQCPRHMVEYSPTHNGTEFWDSKLNFGETDSDCESENEDYKYSLQRFLRDNRKTSEDIDVANVVSIITSRRPNTVAFVLAQYYPQLHIDPNFLKGTDQLLYNLLKENSLVSELTITRVRFKRTWSYSDSETVEHLKIFVPKEFAIKRGKQSAFPIFIDVEQSLNEIVKLSTDATPYGNQGPDASGEYWYSAALCFVQFKNKRIQK